MNSIKYICSSISRGYFEKCVIFILYIHWKITFPCSRHVPITHFIRSVNYWTVLFLKANFNNTDKYDSVRLWSKKKKKKKPPYNCTSFWIDYLANGNIPILAFCCREVVGINSVNILFYKRMLKTFISAFRRHHLPQFLCEDMQNVIVLCWATTLKANQGGKCGL